MIVLAHLVFRTHEIFLHGPARPAFLHVCVLMLSLSSRCPLCPAHHLTKLAQTFDCSLPLSAPCPVMAVLNSCER